MGEKYARSQREKEASTAMNIEQTEIILIPDVIWNPVVRYQSIKEINKILIICHIQTYSELDYQTCNKIHKKASEIARMVEEERQLQKGLLQPVRVHHGRHKPPHMYVHICKHTYIK